MSGFGYWMFLCSSDISGIGLICAIDFRLVRVDCCASVLGWMGGPVNERGSVVKGGSVVNSGIIPHSNCCCGLGD